MYLGSGIYSINNVNVFEWFDFSSDKYVTESVVNVGDNMDNNNSKLTSKIKTPL